MMRKFAVVATLMLLSIVASSSSTFVHTAMAATAADSGPDPAGFCGSKCGVRCSKAGVQDRCVKYCGICCRDCGCVPSGTYGHKFECPCYMNKKNSKGKPKCP
ncbi:hypothetical protein Dimus_004548 [Dionaea muscipula]